MKKKILVISILAAVLIILASITPAVGTTIVKSDIEKDVVASPLFAVRTQQSIDEESTKMIYTNYLGKGKQINLFLPKKSMEQIWVDRAVKIFETKPALLDKLLEKMDKIPYIARILNKYDISKQHIKNYMEIIKNNPDILIEDVEIIQVPVDNTPQPLGLSTSNPIGCFIVAIALIPAAFVITLVVLLFTLRIFTCLNINECGDEILKSIFEQMIQGFNQS
ncbi:MAG: hypothetical protein JSW60_04985 [Thermoplasmatales archaeon]|nr:MAG: hypothetical protein JSW60_04985 [Thermoplasmatales archaeon]